jgi:hypothetical protein
MKYTLKGNLLGANCDDRFMPVSNTVVRLYRYRGNAKEATVLTAAQAKETFQIIDEKGIKEKAKYLIAETKTDKAGNYSFTVDGDKVKYEGEVVEFDVHYSKIPDYGQKDTKEPRKFKPFQATLNVLQPRWRETNAGLVSAWNYRISHKLWCFILSLLDIWVICGTLLNCETQQPLSGIEVTAMDDDVISDDKLGTATTDSLGHFCIYYRSKDFKKTFLSPIINVETPLFPLGNGPDIYFKYSYGGSEIFAESPSRARESDRENVGNCFCVTLCIKEVPSGGEETLPSAFFHIGVDRRYHIVLNINSTDGKTVGKSNSAWNNSAFYGNLMLLGSLNKKLNGQPAEYAFEYAELANPGDPIPADGSPMWTDITEHDIGYTLIGLTPKLVPSPDPMIPFIYQPDLYVITSGPLDPGEIKVVFSPGGKWIQVPQAAAMLTGNLINLISTKLASGETDKAGLIPGNSSSPLEKNRYFSLKMKRRQIGNPSSEEVAGISRPIAIFNTIYKNVPQRGSWLPGVSNELGIATIDLAELAASGGCSTISNTLTAKYTAANPNLGAVSLNMTGPGGPHSFDPVVYTTPGEEAHGSANYSGNVSALPKCSYEVRISAELKLTNGEKQHDGIWDRVLFCK